MNVRLLVVTTIPQTIRAFLLPFIRHYRQLGWQVDAASAEISTFTELHQEFDACFDLPLTRSLRDYQHLTLAPTAICQLVENNQYDIIHVHTPIAAFVVRFALRKELKRPKIVYTAHGFHFHRQGNFLTNALFLLLEKIAAPWCDVIITINCEDFKAAKKANFATRLEYMSGIGIDTHIWQANLIAQQDIQQIKQNLKLKEKDVLFLMIAEFNKGKRHHDVLEALKLVPEHIHVAFAGDGITFEEMQWLAKNWGLAHRTHFLGIRKDIPLLIASSYAVILPSQREGLPRSLLEAMSMSRPIIGTNIRGIAELADGECGLLHDVGDIKGLAQRMIEMAMNPERVTQMGINAREKSLSYDIKAIIQAHDKLYKELLA